jgi:hypothetical protein
VKGIPENLAYEKLYFAGWRELIEQGWTIKPIDQNIKDFVETQIKIADKADSAVFAARWDFIKL